MSDDPPQQQRRLRDRVNFFEKVWSGSADSESDTVDATIDVSEIEKRIEQGKKRAASPKIEVRLRQTESPGRSYERADSPTQFPKLRHVEPVEEYESVQQKYEEGELGSGARFVKFERVSVKRTVTESRSEVVLERPESPQHEWYSEYKQHTLHNAPRREFVRSKSEYDSHIAEIRGKFYCKYERPYRYFI